MRRYKTAVLNIAPAVLFAFPVIVCGDPGACPDGFSTTPETETIGTLGSTGCSSVDKNFTNFAVANASVSGIFTTTPSTSNLYFYSQGSFTAGSITAPSSDVGEVFGALLGSSTLGGPGDWYLNEFSNSAGSSSATVTSVVQVNSAAAGNPNLSFYIDGVTLDPDAGIGWMGTAGGTNAILSIVITEIFCVGATTTTNCPAADTGTIVATLNATGQDINNQGDETFIFQCSTGGSGVITCPTATSAFASFLPTLSVATSEQVVLTQDANLSASLDLAGIFTEWQEGAETPEPSAAVLCLIGLLGLGLWRKRRRDYALSVSSSHF